MLADPVFWSPTISMGSVDLVGDRFASQEFDWVRFDDAPDNDTDDEFPRGQATV